MPAESGLIFLDSNIWLYAFLPNQDILREQHANKLIRDSRSNIVLSTQVINEVTNNLIRKGKFVEEDIRSTIRTFYDNFRVEMLDRSVHLKASQLRERYQLSHFDGIIVASALQSGATTLYSEDMHNGLVVEGTLTIVNPFV